jgi:hypothetical protein
MSKYSLKTISLITIIITLLIACEKDIQLNLPKPDEKIVVEGIIEPNFPPIIMLSKNTAYFSKIDLDTYKNLFIHNADVKVNNIKLFEINTSQINDSLNNLSEIMGISVDTIIKAIQNFMGITRYDLSNLNYYIYTTLDTTVWGKIGMKYNLNINIKGEKNISSTTSIPKPLAPDSLWFQDDKSKSGLGFLWIQITDPPNEENFYRMFTLRLNKDKYFIANTPSIVDDRFFNGKTLSTYIHRGTTNITEAIKNYNFGMFDKGDTVIVKFCTIDRQTYDFWKTAEQDIRNNGSPFSMPSNIKSNIINGIGIWSGYGSNYKMVIFK